MCLCACVCVCFPFSEMRQVLYGGWKWGSERQRCGLPQINRVTKDTGSKPGGMKRAWPALRLQMSSLRVCICVSSCKPLCKSGLHPANGAAEKGTEIQAFVWPTSHRFHMSCSPEVNYLQEQCDWSRSAAFRQPLIRCVWFQGVFRARLKQFAWPLLCRIDSFNHTVWCSFMARVGCILHWYEDIITATEHRIWPKLQNICKDPY